MEKYRKDKIDTLGIDKEFLKKIHDLTEIQISVSTLSIVSGEISKLDFEVLNKFHIYIVNLLKYTNDYRKELKKFLFENRNENDSSVTTNKLLNYYGHKITNLIKITNLVQSRKDNISNSFNQNNVYMSNNAQFNVLNKLRDLTNEASDKKISNLKSRYADFRHQNQKTRVEYDDFMNWTSDFENQELKIERQVKDLLQEDQNYYVAKGYRNKDSFYDENDNDNFINSLTLDNDDFFKVEITDVLSLKEEKEIPEIDNYLKKILKQDDKKTQNINKQSKNKDENKSEKVSKEKSKLSLPEMLKQERQIKDLLVKKDMKMITVKELELLEKLTK